ncbi:MAG: ABC transporter ATP-binding protein [bacterium]|jgi:subfamily B ATP-binding cassette protein MsbA
MESLRLYLRIVSTLKPYWRRLVLAVALMVFVAVFSGFSIGMMLPFVNVIFGGSDMLGLTEDAAQAGGAVTPVDSVQENVRQYILSFYVTDSPVDSLVRICLTVLVLYFMKAMFTYFLSVTLIWLEQRVVRDVRNALYAHLHRLSLSYFHANRTGQTISRITNDVSLLRLTISTGFLSFLRDLMITLAYAGIVFWISWRLALVAFVVMLPIAYFVGRLSRRLRKYSTRAQEKAADYTSVLQETVSGIRVVKAFGMERFEKKKFRRDTDGFFNAVMKQQRAAVLAPPMTEFLGALGALAVLWYGGMQVLEGNLLTPDWFLIFLGAMLSIMHPAKSLVSANSVIQEGLAAGKRIFSLLDTEPEIADSPGAVEVDGIHEYVRFVDVSFAYDGDDFVLKDVNLTVKKGQIVALVGPSGAGKSTLVDLVARFYDPVEGRVELDGVDIRSIRIDSLRSLMGIVTQETILFNDSVFNNIAYGLEDIAHERVIEAARAANAHDFVEGLAEGYDTVIGDRGVRLSGGERQRIAIARALLKDPQIFIFDEATSSLDSESEKLVQEAIQRLMTTRTTFVIAHRLSTVSNADLIVVIDNGRVVETGDHENLLAEGGLYKKLYDIQFRDYSPSTREG